MDAVILLVAGALTFWLMRRDHPLTWIVPMAVGHFFLFCNVFLVWRTWELLWAGVFVLNVFYHVTQDDLSWWPACGWQMPVTLLVILLQLRSPWYHGVFARKINPRLDEYLHQKL